MTPGPYDPIGAWDDDTGESLGAMLARARLDSGRSQLRLAELLCAAAGLATVTRHEISRWEREERIPTVYWLRWLAVVLDVPLDGLELAAAVARSRRAGRSPARVAGAGAPRPDAAGALSGPAGHEPLHKRIAALRRMDDLIGGADLLQIVVPELRAAAGAAADRDPAAGRSGSSRQQLRWSTAVADLAQLTTWVAADAGAPGALLGAYRIGVRASARVADRPLAGHLLGTVAQLTAESGDPRRALRLARLARRRAAPVSSAATRALQWHRVAFAAARAGARRTCEQALHHAERAYERRDRQLDPSWLYWYDEAHFTAMTGRCYAALGRPHLARPLLVAALGSGRLAPRAAAVHASWLAGISADARDLDTASALATEALLNAVRTGSVRATRHVRALDARLLVRSTDPSVRHYAELVSTALPYLPRPAPAQPGPAGRPDSVRASF
ncbi:MAG TPA: helix-turn-helix domain-containing protein [Micromonosporaceae bacterium]|nr:helix-turn-helix domain-containing protein [Micromonosporaceae bacterium]